MGPKGLQISEVLPHEWEPQTNKHRNLQISKGELEEMDNAVNGICFLKEPRGNNVASSENIYISRIQRQVIPFSRLWWGKPDHVKEVLGIKNMIAQNSKRKIRRMKNSFRKYNEKRRQKIGEKRNLEKQSRRHNVWLFRNSEIVKIIKEMHPSNKW